MNKIDLSNEAQRIAVSTRVNSPLKNDEDFSLLRMYVVSLLHDVNFIPFEDISVQLLYLLQRCRWRLAATESSHKLSNAHYTKSEEIFLILCSYTGKSEIAVFDLQLPTYISIY